MSFHLRCRFVRWENRRSRQIIKMLKYFIFVSSIDRYLAVRFPIKYKQRTRAVKILTIIMLSLTWLSAICFSIAPMWAPTLKYGFISGAIMVFVIPDDSQVSPISMRSGVFPVFQDLLISDHL